MHMIREQNIIAANAVNEYKMSQTHKQPTESGYSFANIERTRFYTARLNQRHWREKKNRFVAHRNHQHTRHRSKCNGTCFTPTEFIHFECEKKNAILHLLADIGGNISPHTHTQNIPIPYSVSIRSKTIAKSKRKYDNDICEGEGILLVDRSDNASRRLNKVKIGNNTECSAQN